MESIKEVLMRRDEMTEADADDLIEEAKELLANYLAQDEIELAEQVCAEMFGLEPDYLMELM